MTVDVAILGSTGSIGTQALDIVRHANNQAAARGDDPAYRVVGLGAGSAAAVVAAQAVEFEVSSTALADPTQLDALRDALPVALASGAGAGASALNDCIVDADVVINGIVGFAGLDTTIETLKAGKRLGLANKESLIAAGPVVRRVRQTPGAEIVPVDSEHCALHQCLRANESFDGDRMDQVRKLIVIASGGPFRGRSSAQLREVTVEGALNHPTWSMGPKITVDSSTLMNKGLEVIEANELFGVGFDRIDVVVHPQSVVHSMVEYTDGATLAQLSMPDMRLCIAYALDFDDRHEHAYGGIDWSTLSRLDFELPDREAFPCLDLAYHAGRLGGTAPAVLSAANEVAVDAFLHGVIGWLDIARAVEAVLAKHNGERDPDLDAILAADAWARAHASEYVAT